MLFLWNVDFTDTKREIKLTFYDSSSGEIKKFSVSNYKPYFLVTYPLSKDAEEKVASLQGEVELVKKRNLFTDEIVQLVKIKAWTPILLKKLLKQFGNAWESEIEYGRSYIYDSDLVFGAPYTQQNDSFIVIKDVQQDLKQKFKKAFA